MHLPQELCTLGAQWQLQSHRFPHPNTNRVLPGCSYLCGVLKGDLGCLCHLVHILADLPHDGCNAGVRIQHIYCCVPVQGHHIFKVEPAPPVLACQGREQFCAWVLLICAVAIFARSGHYVMGSQEAQQMILGAGGSSRGRNMHSAHGWRQNGRSSRESRGGACL